MAQHTPLTPEQKAELKKQEKALFEADPKTLPIPPTLSPSFTGAPRVFGQDIGLGQDSSSGSDDKGSEKVISGLERISAQIIETQDIISNLPSEIARELGVP